MSEHALAHLRPLRTTRARRAVLAVLLALGGALTGLGGTAQAQPPCPAGSFCGYPDADYRGEPELPRTDALEQCQSLSADPELRSFINNTGRPVTVYQDPECDPHAEFATYPTGTFVPGSPFVARAIKVWPR